MAKGRLKKVFPGGNTSKGFYSFYDQIIEQDATHIFVIKGGPGVGKSTFMRKIGETFLDLGYDVEFHCCSSDNGSIDGVVLSKLKIALLDGTSPHVVDPKNPGAVDDIIHLGDYWNENGLRAHKKEILILNQETWRLFRRAYSYLAAANLFLKEVRSFYRDTGTFNTGTYDKLVLELTHEIFEGQSRQTDNPKSRHLFATAITPEGPVSYLHTIVGHLKKRYIISGDDGTGKTTLIRRLTEAAMMRGFNVEVFHCALDPERAEHLVIPALDLALVNAVEPHYYKPHNGDVEIDTMTCIKPIENELICDERDTAREMYRRSFEEAVEFINRAKETHDEMEKYYIPYMNFDHIEARRQKVLARIFELIK